MGTLTYLQTGGGLLVVLGLIALVAFIARKAGLGTAHIKREDRRLSIVETMTLDPKRRVLLIKCDYTEHLVLLGPNSETLLSGRPPERAAYQSAPQAPNASNVAAPPANAAPASPRSSAAARASTLATGGPTKLNQPSQPLGDRPSTWATRKAPPADPSGRREPQLGPVPRDPK